MPMELNEYKKLLEKEKQALLIKLLDYSHSHPELRLDSTIESTTGLPDNSKTSQLCRNMRSLLESSIRIFNDPNNKSSTFLVESLKLRRLECEYLRLRLIQADYTYLDNDLLSSMAFISLNSPSSRSWGAGALHYNFKQKLIEFQQDYHKGIMPTGAGGAPGRMANVETIARQGQILSEANRFERVIDANFDNARIQELLSSEDSKEESKGGDPLLDLKVEISKAVRRQGVNDIIKESPNKIARDLAIAFAKRVASIEDKAAENCFVFVREKKAEEASVKATLKAMREEMQELRLKSLKDDTTIERMKAFMDRQPMGPAINICRDVQIQMSRRPSEGVIGRNSMFASGQTAALPPPPPSVVGSSEDDASSTASGEDFSSISSRT